MIIASGSSSRHIQSLSEIIVKKSAKKVVLENTILKVKLAMIGN